MKRELRIMVFALSMILASLFIIHPVYAQTATQSSENQLPTTAYNPPPTTYYQLPATISPTSPLYTDLLVNNLFHSFSCLAVGQSVIGQPCLTYQVTRNAQGMIQSVPMLSSVNLSGGTLGAVASVIGAMYTNPPVRTADYLASMGQDFGIVKEAHAQVGGSGAAVLSPIISLWQVSRNISYVFMIIIFVVIGLMVMFRNKINPQTVITAQAALPGLVIGLILITFSYFLAGLISDMAFVGTNVVGYYFSIAQRPNDPPQNLLEDIRNQNVLSIFAPLTGTINKDNVSYALGSIWHSLERPNVQQWNPLDMDPARAITAIAMMLIAQLVMPFGSMFGGLGQGVAAIGTAVITSGNPTAVVGLALAFIAMVILIYTMFKLLLRLINSYITIIFLTITAPFQFLAAALPGRQGIATGWILNMLANILAFPAVLAVLYFVAYLLGPTFIKDYYPSCQGTNPQSCVFRISQLNQAEQNSLVPVAHAATPSRIVDTTAFPLFGELDLDFVRIILAFGALIALPKIPDLVANAIGKMSQAGQMIGQEIGGSIAQGRQYAGQFQQGTGGFANQVGRLTTTTSEQLAPNPAYGKAGEPKYLSVENKQLGQIGRARYGWGKFWGDKGLGGKIKSRFER